MIAIKLEITNQTSDEYYMKRALELAVRGDGFVNPNPRVGAVIVKNGNVIGEGYHQRFGELHAERNALRSCTEDPAGSTVYVTLEPCCHYGKTPPCTEALIAAKPARVVVGSDDPNPKVAGKGIRILRDAGIEVVRGFMKEECDAINGVFFRYITTGLPTVTMKYAMTADGKIATVTGKSKWISSEASRTRENAERGHTMSIMVGVGTVLPDDPMLTCRDGKGLSPTRIICDTNLRTPLSAAVIRTASDAESEGGNEMRTPQTILATAVSEEERLAPYREKGAEILILPKGEDGRIDLRALLQELGKRQIDTVLVEGGGTLNASCLKQQIADRVRIYIAPKLFGGAGARTPVEGAGIDEPSDCPRLRSPKITGSGGDLLIESEVEYVHRNH
ncbi:MAG: bifunctional diaminohydroxyphosphoribosylaminopyrimidine deaminase/5-amino-6-(5-phosphoribosylamino)uracil reductase RibD [Anaerovoracaceae bacterium]